MHSEGNAFCPTLQFRKEPKDLPNAHGCWRYLFHLVKYEFRGGGEREKERAFFKVAGATTALVQQQQIHHAIRFLKLNLVLEYFLFR